MAIDDGDVEWRSRQLLGSREPAESCSNNYNARAPRRGVDGGHVAILFHSFSFVNADDHIGIYEKRQIGGDLELWCGNGCDPHRGCHGLPFG